MKKSKVFGEYVLFKEGLGDVHDGKEAGDQKYKRQMQM